jgi:hypothetical protein
MNLYCWVEELRLREGWLFSSVHNDEFHWILYIPGYSLLNPCKHLIRILKKSIPTKNIPTCKGGLVSFVVCTLL